MSSERVHAKHSIMLEALSSGDVISVVLLLFCVWVVAQMAEHRTVTAASEGSTPFGPPKFNGAPRLIAKRLKSPALNQAIVGSNPTRAANFSYGTVAER